MHEQHEAMENKLRIFENFDGEPNLGDLATELAAVTGSLDWTKIPVLDRLR